MRKLLTFLIIFLFTFNGAALAASDTYLNELSSSKPFSRVPIKVWVQDSVYKNTVYSAFGEWNRASGGCVRFEHANSEKAAQIRVYFVRTIPDNIAGLTYPYATDKNTVLSLIKIAVYPAGVKKAITQKEAFAVAVHEIGHAIGLQGHSSNRNDIMYPDTSMIGIYASRRDYNTIRRVYCR